MPEDISVSFFEQEKIELDIIKPTSRLSSLFADDDIISPVSDDAQKARIALQNEYKTQKTSISKSKSVVNATNLFNSNRLRLPR